LEFRLVKELINVSEFDRKHHETEFIGIASHKSTNNTTPEDPVNNNGTVGHKLFVDGMSTKQQQKRERKRSRERSRERGQEREVKRERSREREG